MQALFLKTDKGQVTDIKSLSWQPVKAQESATVTSQVLAEVPKRTSLKLSFILGKYLTVQRQDGIGEKTLGDKRSVVELLIRIVGDLPMHSYQRRHAQAFKEKALK